MSSPIRILLCSGSDAGISAQLALQAAKKSGWACIDWSTQSAHGENSQFHAALLQALGSSQSSAVVSESWASTSIVRSVARALRIKEELDKRSEVVINCGEISQFLTDINDVRALREIARHAMRPELLMDAAGRVLNAELRDAVGALDALFESMGSEAVIRLAVRPDACPDRGISEISLDCAVLGIVLDCVVVASVEKKKGKLEVRRILRELLELRPDISVLRTEKMRVGPKRQQVQHRCTEGVAVGAVLESAGVDRGQYRGEVLAVGLDSSELRVGVLDESLVLATPRVRRVLPLPSTLVRCVPIDAGVGENGVHIHFSADPSLWPESLITEAELPVGDGDD